MSGLVDTLFFFAAFSRKIHSRSANHNVPANVTVQPAACQRGRPHIIMYVWWVKITNCVRPPAKYRRFFISIESQRHRVLCVRSSCVGLRVGLVGRRRVGWLDLPPPLVVWFRLVCSRPGSSSQAVFTSTTVCVSASRECARCRQGCCGWCGTIFLVCHFPAQKKLGITLPTIPSNTRSNHLPTTQCCWL